MTQNQKWPKNKKWPKIKKWHKIKKTQNPKTPKPQNPVRSHRLQLLKFSINRLIGPGVWARPMARTFMMSSIESIKIDQKGYPCVGMHVNHCRFKFMISLAHLNILNNMVEKKSYFGVWMFSHACIARRELVLYLSSLSVIEIDLARRKSVSQSVRRIYISVFLFVCQ